MADQQQTAPARQLAITKRVSLSDVSDGWDECYALVRPANLQERIDFNNTDLKSMTPEQQLDVEMNLIMEHFVSGKLKVVGSDGEPALVDMEPADVKMSVPLADKLFFEILGIADPKVQVA